MGGETLDGGDIPPEDQDKEEKCPKCGAMHSPDEAPSDSSQPYEMDSEQFDKIATDPSSGKIDPKNIAEVEAGIAAQEAGLIGKIVPPPKTHGGLELGYDLFTILAEQIDVKAFRPHDLKPGKLDKTIRNAEADPQKKLLLDPRHLCDRQVEAIRKKLSDELGEDRVIVAPRKQFRAVKGV